MKLGSVQFTVRSLTVHRVPEKLLRGGVTVLACRGTEKNALEVKIARKDAEKAFAILRGSCYNIENVREVGLSRLLCAARTSAGLLAGALLFLALILFFESRVLLVRVEGSGACYEREILAILGDEGVSTLSPLPWDTGLITARVLALPRVEFCSFRSQGGILTVEVQCSENAEPIADMPLTSSVDGVVESLLVLRGRPLVSEGERVERGQTLVEGGGSFVVAKATISYEVRRVYAGSERAARAQAALDFGDLTKIRIGKTEQGWLAEGIARATVSRNLA